MSIFAQRQLRLVLVVLHFGHNFELAWAKIVVVVFCCCWNCFSSFWALSCGENLTFSYIKEFFASCFLDFLVFLERNSKNFDFFFSLMKSYAKSLITLITKHAKECHKNVWKIRGFAHLVGEWAVELLQELNSGLRKPQFAQLVCEIVIN